MAISIDIKGEGKVDRVTEDNSVILTAVPDESWHFKYFIADGAKVSENPFTADTGKYKEITAVFYVTIEDYLKGLVGFDVTESAMNSIRISRSIAKGEDVEELSRKDKDLLYADLLMWAASSPTNYTGSKEADGGWQHVEASKTISVTDKKRFENQAMTIYKRYLDRKYNSGIRIVNLW